MWSYKISNANSLMILCFIWKYYFALYMKILFSYFNVLWRGKSHLCVIFICNLIQLFIYVNKDCS